MTKRMYMTGTYVTGLLFLIVAVGYYRTTSDIAARFASYVAYPVIATQHNLLMQWHSMQTWMVKNDELIKQRAELQRENEQLLETTITLQARLRDLQDTQELRDYVKEQQASEVIIAQVLVKNISPQTHFFLIDAGANKGIKKNMIVTYKHGLLGKIDAVYPWYSKVTLITDVSCKVAACCASTQAMGIHQGTNNEYATQLMRVSHLDTVQEGDLLLSTGQGLIFPRGYGLGYISACKQNGLTYDIKIKPLFDISSINYCCVGERA